MDTKIVKVYAEDMPAICFSEKNNLGEYRVEGIYGDTGSNMDYLMKQLSKQTRYIKS